MADMKPHLAITVTDVDGRPGPTGPAAHERGYRHRDRPATAPDAAAALRGLGARALGRAGRRPRPRPLRLGRTRAGGARPPLLGPELV